jgi:mRNA interferase HigB
MRVISRKALKRFAEIHPESLVALDHWYRLARKAVWANLSDVRKAFPHANFVNPFTLFNIGGNRYRLVTRIEYRHWLIFVRHVLTHREYDKGKWKQ